ncbi:MAG: hypothetical protein V4609_17915 [Pseudomonadota bacterium]
MAVTPTGSHRNLLSPAVSQHTPSDPADVSNAPETKSAPRRSFKPGDVAVYHAGIWARSRSPSRHNEPLFAHRFGPTTQAGRAMDRALKELAPGMFDAVVRMALHEAREKQKQGPSRDRRQGDLAGHALADALFKALRAEPQLQQFLHKLGGAIGPRQARQSPAYCALAYCGLKPALEALRAQVGDAAGRGVVDGMLDALPNLRMKADAGHGLSQLLDAVKEKGPAPAVLEAWRHDQLLAHTARASEAVQKGVKGLAADQPANAGKAVLLSAAWAPARTQIEAVLKVGAGDVLEDLVGRLALKAQAQRKGGAELAIFFAKQLQADLPKLLQALRPSMGLLREVQASVNGWASGKLSLDTRDSVLPNIVMVLGLAQAAKARAAFADGAHRQALEVLAKVACAVAQGDAASLTRWLWPGQADAVRQAVGETAQALRHGLREVTAPTVPLQTPAFPVDNKHTPQAQQVSGDNVNPAQAERPSLMGPAVKAREAVQAAVSTLSAVPHPLVDAGKSVLLSPAWTEARTEIEAAMEAGAGQFFEQLAKRLAGRARKERMDRTDMSMFFAKQLRFALPKIKAALGPIRDLMHGVQSDVNQSALAERFAFTRECVLPNLVMVLGLARAATAQATRLADGPDKEALETLAKVARAVAQDDDASLTHGLRPAKALPICWAVHDTAVALRKALKAVTSAAPAPVPEPADGRDHKHGLQVQPTPDRDSRIQAANFQRPPNHVGLAAQRPLDDSSESEVVESEDEEAPPQLLEVQDRDPVTVGESPTLVAVARAQDDNEPPAPVFHLHTSLPEAGGPPERSTSAPVRFHHLHAQMAQRTGATGSGNAVL